MLIAYLLATESHDFTAILKRLIFIVMLVNDVMGRGGVQAEKFEQLTGCNSDVIKIMSKMEIYVVPQANNS